MYPSQTTLLRTFNISSHTIMQATHSNNSEDILEDLREIISNELVGLSAGIAALIEKTSGKLDEHISMYKNQRLKRKATSQTAEQQNKRQMLSDNDIIIPATPEESEDNVIIPATPEELNNNVIIPATPESQEY